MKATKVVAIAKVWGRSVLPALAGVLIFLGVLGVAYHDLHVDGVGAWIPPKDLPTASASATLHVLLWLGAFGAAYSLIVVGLVSGRIGLIYGVRLGRSVFVGPPKQLLMIRALRVPVGGSVGLSSEPRTYASVLAPAQRWTIASSGSARVLRRTAPCGVDEATVHDVPGLAVTVVGRSNS